MTKKLTESDIERIEDSSFQYPFFYTKDVPESILDEEYPDGSVYISEVGPPEHITGLPSYIKMINEEPNGIKNEAVYSFNAGSYNIKPKKII